MTVDFSYQAQKHFIINFFLKIALKGWLVTLLLVFEKLSILTQANCGMGDK
jgi:hypothetical protein